MKMYVTEYENSDGWYRWRHNFYKLTLSLQCNAGWTELVEAKGWVPLGDQIRAQCQGPVLSLTASAVMCSWVWVWARPG